MEMPSSRSGTLDGRCKPQRGSFIFNWRIALESARETILQTKQTTGTRVTFEDLLPGQRYAITVNVVGAAGPTDFSSPMSLMAI